MKPWIITAAILIIAIVLGLWQLKPVQVIEADSGVQAMNGSNATQASSKNVSPNGVSNPNASNTQSSATQPSNTPNKQLTGNKHFDQMTPEMQQALKESLLLENPSTTIDGQNGTVILPSQGRFTQMPVAVQMPDGSIQIREYSEIPKNK